jgi:hypothetical protein
MEKTPTNRNDIWLSGPILRRAAVPILGKTAETEGVIASVASMWQTPGVGPSFYG